MIKKNSMIRKIDFKTDYREIKQWYTAWGWEPMPKENLPDTTFVLEREGQKIVCGSLYMAKSGGMCISEWVIMNPEAKKRLRGNAVECLLTYMSEYAKKEGCKFIFCSTKNKRFMIVLESQGYVKTDENTTNFLKVL